MCKVLVFSYFGLIVFSGMDLTVRLIDDICGVKLTAWLFSHRIVFILKIHNNGQFGNKR
ncbi:hypothetical protein NC99_12810 [Sunxiuqinia dokdonensis]|uniref:Uncharacterized protein n=1 Tax=Sunxiuqinia dokdonensis TaxID=1409788 RepID=A0A0L8VBP1_9BACT|nr:hypothetical protein NC99_12810 [Sunxiuqinia dokdonensis]